MLYCFQSKYLAEHVRKRLPDPADLRYVPKNVSEKLQVHCSKWMLDVDLKMNLDTKGTTTYNAVLHNDEPSNLPIQEVSFKEAIQEATDDFDGLGLVYEVGSEDDTFTSYHTQVIEFNEYKSDLAFLLPLLRLYPLYVD
jgi:hypothetical protein